MRRIVIIACGAQKRPVPEGQRRGWPAGELYTGQYHASLRRAADALTDQADIRIASALHGLVPLSRPLFPYDVTLGDPQAITPDRMAQQAAALCLDAAHVLFLGGRKYAELLGGAIPLLHSPLVGGLGAHRGLCRRAREDAALRGAWWARAAELHIRRTPGAARRPAAESAALGT